MILGHAHPLVIENIKETVSLGTSFGAPTEKEVVLAEMICEAVPSVEMVRLVSSGTEAVMSAIRVARAYTKRDLIIKFEGCYHGHVDSMLVKAGSGAMTHDAPDSEGVPVAFAKHTITIPFNNEIALEEVFNRYPNSIAAIIMEPVPANMGLVLPKEGFLQFCRSITQKYDALLIFDEVITGFRASYAGASGIYDIQPDLSVYGKIIGGGLPVGAYGGRKDIMSLVSPLGKVYQAGTLSGNPVAVTAGISTLQILRDTPQIYHQLENTAKYLAEGLKRLSMQYQVDTQIHQMGSLVSMFFASEAVIDYATALTSDLQKFTQYFQTMFSHGIYIAPSQFEALFISSAHTKEDIEKALEISEIAMKKISCQL
jgi:glutamate-1-semialdehyde 2,1-aminomutase